MSLEEDIAETQRQLQPLFPKPVLKDNLLTKPPFRFVHDVVSAVTKATGFGEKLFGDRPDLMDAKAIKEKQDKLDYLDRVILFVGNWHGRPCDIKSGKVVAGVEPERTNRFFVDLANAARDCNPGANAAVVERTVAGQQPDPAFARGESGGGSGAKDDGGAKAPSPEDKDSDGPGPAGAAQAKPPPSRGGGQRTTNGPKEEVAPRSGGMDVMGPESTPSFEAEVEQCTGEIEVTITMVGGIISKPKMTAKLLEKPPFRFLHDVFSAVCESTGFGAGLLDPEEKDAKELSKASKEAKVAFLEKVKSLVGFSLNTMVEARPAKIVAGLEPNNTNRLLQLLAVAAKHCPDSAKAVAMARGEEPAASSSSAAADSSSSGQAAAAAPPSQAPAKDEQPQAASSSSSSAASRSAEPAQSKDSSSSSSAAAQGKSAPASSSAAMAKDANDMGASSSMGGGGGGGGGDMEDKAGDGGGGGGGGDEGFDGDGEPKRSMRPTTARRRPPKVKDNVKALEASNGASGGGGGGGLGSTGGASAAAAAKPSGIMVDGADGADDSDDEQEAKDAKGEGGFGGGMGVVADTAEGASKLVREIEDEARAGGGGAAEAKDDGTKGIRLGRIKKTAELGKSGAGGSGAKKSMSSWSEQDIEALRSSVQRLCMATNPLGKCMDFVHEDLGAMAKEHEKWTQE